MFYDQFYDCGGESIHGQIVKLVCFRAMFNPTFEIKISHGILLNVAVHRRPLAWRHPLLMVYYDSGGPTKPLFSSNWGESVHEDWKWFMVLCWQRMDTSNFWSQICSMAKISAPNQVNNYLFSPFSSIFSWW